MSEIAFPHHRYQSAPRETDYELISAAQAESVLHACSEEQLATTALRLREANVAEVVLIHGTFAGNDIIGFVREIARFSPRLAQSMRALGKKMIDQIVGELGNYTQDYADRMSELLGGNGIVVSRFDWSGENHHLGRAGGAIELIDRLASTKRTANDRVLCWAHSHGGNMLAMMSQLIGATDQARDQFFAVTKAHYRDPLLGRLDLPKWERVRDFMAKPDFRDRLPQLDAVTFGTPLRYRWQTGCVPRLLHFVHHRPLDPKHPATATLPDSIEDVLHARGGDYVQQFGIGGTDFLHAFYAWRSWRVERTLRKMFEPTVRRRDLAANLRCGLRASQDGTSLLVDYPNLPSESRSPTQGKRATAGVKNNMALGHALYTRHEWLPFHLHEVSSRLYSVEAAGEAKS